MDRIEFKDVTVKYNEEKINKELCKKKRIYMNLWVVLTALLMMGSLFLGVWLTQDMSDKKIAIYSIVFGILFFSITTGFIYIGYRIIYQNIPEDIKSYSIMEYLFRVMEVNAGWYNDKILLRVQNVSRTEDYSLEEFVHYIKNEIIIVDNSTKNKPIHIFIDVTDNDKTEVRIENVPS